VPAHSPTGLMFYDNTFEFRCSYNYLWNYQQKQRATILTDPTAIGYCLCTA